MKSRPALARPRRLAGWLLAAAGVPLLTLVLTQLRGTVTLPTVLLAFLAMVVATAATGGTGPGVIAALGGFLMANYYFTPPLYRWIIADAEHAVALLVFLGVALIVSRVVDIAAHREHEAAGAQSHAQDLAEANALRSALLQAVSHDLRTPLASIKASASSLAQRDIEWSAEETAEFVRTINEETDRMTALVGNLLDMSRIQAGVLRPALSPTPLEEVLPAAVMSVGHSRSTVDTSDVGEDMPLVLTDPALLERALANVIENAVRFSHPSQRVEVSATTSNGEVELRVVDHGRGIPVPDRQDVFEPFQRLGDSGKGVGLGLAVARGFLSAMGGSIAIEDTAGGGTTMLIRLPVAP